MNIKVRFFAILKDRAGVAEAVLDLPPGATVASATRAVAERFPQMSRDLPRAAAAINRNYVNAQSLLHDGDELALIPPVSGGAI